MNKATVYFRPVAPLGVQQTFTQRAVGVVGDPRIDPVLGLYAVAKPQEVSIDGGFGAERLSFLLRISSDRTGQMERHSRIYGYTDPLVSIPEGANIPGDTKLYFNRLMELTTAMFAGVGGVKSFTCVNRDHHILTREQGLGVPVTYRLRPEDVLNRLASRHAIQDLGLGDQPMDIRNMVGTGSGPVLAKVYDENPVAWWESIKCGLRGADEPHRPRGCFEEGYYGAARVIETGPLANRQFFDKLRLATNYMQDGYITMDELRSLYELDVTVDMSEDVLDDAMGSTENIGYSGSVYSMAAHLVLSVVMPVMGMYGVDELAISTDNDTDEFICTWPGMFADGQFPKELTDDVPPPFEEALLTALSTLKKNMGWVRMNINAHLNMLNKGVMQVDIDQTKEVVHLPLYASARLSRLLTNDEALLEDLGRFIEIAHDEYGHRLIHGSW